MNLNIRPKNLAIIAFLFLLALFFRLHHIEFGLPHSFHADEPEIAELAIKYTYEARDILENGNYYKLIPVSFVYGTFPIYLLTAAVMLFSKTANLLSIGFDKTTLFVYQRVLVSLFSFTIVPIGALLYQKLFKDRFGTLLTIIFLGLNWKLIVHAHYVNPDIILTTLFILSCLCLFHYQKDYQQNIQGTKVVVLTALAFGLAVGTKITALLSLPFFLYVFFWQKDWKSALGFLLVTLAVFLTTNPFSLIFSDQFAYRIFEMAGKEAGMVFDSVDSNPFKYVLALGFITTPVILTFSLYRKSSLLRLSSKSDEKNRPFHIFLMGSVVIYLIFFSLGGRRVDRWLLPILPIVIIYASYGISQLRKRVKAPYFNLLLLFTLTSCFFYPLLLLRQFRRYTPKSEAYLWLKENTKEITRKLVITEEGLDPMNKLKFSKVHQVNVYTTEGAKYDFPEDPAFYHYIVLSSKPMQNFKREEVKKAYPLYVQKWEEFENEILHSGNYKLIKFYVLPKPNLVQLSDVYIYENSNPLPITANQLKPL